MLRLRALQLNVWGLQALHGFEGLGFRGVYWNFADGSGPGYYETLAFCRKVLVRDHRPFPESLNPHVPISRFCKIVPKKVDFGDGGGLS